MGSSEESDIKTLKINRGVFTWGAMETSGFQKDRNQETLKMEIVGEYNVGEWYRTVVTVGENIKKVRIFCKSCCHFNISYTSSFINPQMV